MLWSVTTREMRSTDLDPAEVRLGIDLDDDGTWDDAPWATLSLTGGLASFGEIEPRPAFPGAFVPIGCRGPSEPMFARDEFPRAEFPSD